MQGGLVYIPEFMLVMKFFLYSTDFMYDSTCIVHYVKKTDAYYNNQAVKHCCYKAYYVTFVANVDGKTVT